MTSSPMPMPSARKAATSAEVQEFTASACRTPMNSPKSFSASATLLGFGP